MVSRQVTIVGSGMRRIDDRGRHLRRDVGRLSRIDDAKTFKAAKKKLGIMSRRGRFGRDGEWSWTLLTKVAAGLLWRFGARSLPSRRTGW